MAGTQQVSTLQGTLPVPATYSPLRYFCCPTCLASYTFFPLNLLLPHLAALNPDMSVITVMVTSPQTLIAHHYDVTQRSCSSFTQVVETARTGPVRAPLVIQRSIRLSSTAGCLGAWLGAEGKASWLYPG